jgi:hypothetical protein
MVGRRLAIRVRGFGAHRAGPREKQEADVATNAAAAPEVRTQGGADAGAMRTAVPADRMSMARVRSASAGIVPRLL